jgi:hypothetical protein
MSSPPVKDVEISATSPEAPKSSRPAPSAQLNPFTVARIAKKKAKRLRHRTQLRRSHTGG